MILRWLSLLLLLSPMLAPAQALRPNAGLWWEEPVTGRFYAVEIAPSGRAFVVISEFDEQGKPVWRTMRGDLVVTSAQEQAAGAPLATLTAPLLELDGACPSCPVSAPNAHPSALGNATIVFRSNTEAEYLQGALRRPLRYFSPADQPADFPSARLAGDYALMLRSATTGGSTRTARLTAANDAACVRFEGTQPAPGHVRFSAGCPGGVCESSPAGLLLTGLEIAVDPGEHPSIRAYRRSLAPEGILRPLPCQIPGFAGLICACPEGYTAERDPNPTMGVTVGAIRCVANTRPMLCTESHRISAQAGVLHGQPVNASEASFVLYPIPN